jgi:hypothetical protein
MYGSNKGENLQSHFTGNIYPNLQNCEEKQTTCILLGGVQQIQLKIEGRDNGDLGAVAP